MKAFINDLQIALCGLLLFILYFLMKIPYYIYSILLFFYMKLYKIIKELQNLQQHE